MTDPTTVTRRDIIAAATLTTAALALSESSLAQAPSPTPAPAALKPLPFDPAKLNGLSERLIRSHWENNYGGSVRALAVVRKQLADASASKYTQPYIYNALKREHLVRTGSVVLHELYFENLGGKGSADASARKAISESFGTFDTWESEFRRIGAGLGGGSGWVMFGYNLHTREIENYWMADHAHGPTSVLPLLVMDMYEHSYQMDFGAAAAKYIDAFFSNINWDVVTARLESARKADLKA